MRSSTYSSLDSLRSLDLAVDAGDGPAQATSARFQPQNYLAVFGTGGRLTSRFWAIGVLPCLVSIQAGTGKLQRPNDNKVKDTKAGKQPW